MDEIAVDFRALEDGEASLRRTVDAIEAHLRDLEACLGSLLDQWTGQAAQAYREAQYEWNRAASDMQQNLRDLHGLLVTAHGNHAAAVQASTAIWTV